MGRIREATNHFFIEGLDVSGLTTSDNVYFLLKGEQVDLVNFKLRAIRFIGLSLNPEKLNKYIQAYREVGEKYNIKIKGLEDGKIIIEPVVPVEVLSSNDSSGSAYASEVSETDTELVSDSGSEGSEEVDVEEAPPEKEEVVVEEAPKKEKVVVAAKKPKKAKEVAKPTRRRRSAPKTGGLTVGAVKKG